MTQTTAIKNVKTKTYCKHRYTEDTEGRDPNSLMMEECLWMSKDSKTHHWYWFLLWSRTEVSGKFIWWAKFHTCSVFACFTALSHNYLSKWWPVWPTYTGSAMNGVNSIHLLKWWNWALDFQELSSEVRNWAIHNPNLQTREDMLKCL